MADKYTKMTEYQLYQECLKVFGGVPISYDAGALREMLREKDFDAPYKRSLGERYGQEVQ